MNGTPRLRSAYPSTPLSTGSRGAPSRSQHGSSLQSSGSSGTPTGTTTTTTTTTTNTSSPKLKDINTLSANNKPSADNTEGPVIPLTTLDAPTQRFWAFTFWTFLLIWRLYDFFLLQQDDTESLWLFMKWIAMDGVFLFGLPGLRIPWLEWSSTTMTILFLFHAIIDAIMMFRIEIPITAPLVALAKVMYDKELSISENRVRKSDLTNDPRLILGRFEIHIVPEGSALLNPDEIPLCIDPTSPRSAAGSVYLPIHINQTTPNTIDLIRHDLDTSRTETITIGRRQVQNLLKDAQRHQLKGASGADALHYRISKPGLYKLGKVLDHEGIEVQHPVSESLVVSCPSARLVSSYFNTRCRGDNSDMMIEVSGTPPLKIKYRKSVDGNDQDVSYQSIQPDDFITPIARGPADSGGLSLVHESDSRDLSWARAYKINLSLNETVLRGQNWAYSIDEVSDAVGNSISYATVPDDEYDRPRPKESHLEDAFTIYDLPVASVDREKARIPILLAQGKSMPMPVRFGLGTASRRSSAHDQEVTYIFTPEDQLSVTGHHQDRPKELKAFVVNGELSPAVSQPGLYTLHSVSDHHCNGTIDEPSSFMLTNPPPPALDISTSPIVDKCAQRSIGMMVEMNLTGTPPFWVTYSTESANSKQKQPRQKVINGLRETLEFKPASAGHHRYSIYQVGDSVYPDGVPVNPPKIIEQEVRPSVSASFAQAPPQSACIDTQVPFSVRFQGEGPWTLEYELVHGRKRIKRQITDVSNGVENLTTDVLTDGGHYTLTLISVKDKEGCREILQESASIHVQHQRPRAGFGLIEGRRSVLTLEGSPVGIPLRFSGEPPWSIEIVAHDASSEKGRQPQTKHFKQHNDVLKLTEPGNYEITRVGDKSCPGVVDEKANVFTVGLVDRPQVSIPTGPLIIQRDGKYIRNDVCEGDEDSLELSLSGRPPYDVKYQQHTHPNHGSKSLRKTEVTVPMNSAQIQLDTSKAGRVDYIFSELGDFNYDHDPHRHEELIVQQRVHPRPAATFADAGKVYRFCQSTASALMQDSHHAAVSANIIPITLTGRPPFTVDFEIRPQGSKAVKGETLTIPNIPSTSHNLQLPPRLLSSGTSSLIIRRVRDGHGCERLYDPLMSSLMAVGSNNNKHVSVQSAPPTPRVQISVHDEPVLSALEPHRQHYCVGDRLGFALSGVAPFTVFYNFNGASRKVVSTGATFRRIAESPGNFTITGLADSSSACRADVHGMQRIIHALPSVRVSKGRTVNYDIHVGGSAEVLFEFGGEPPFEFTYTRSEKFHSDKVGGSGGRKDKVLETRTLVSHERSLKVKETEEGAYEVVAVRDRHCSAALPGYEGLIGGGGTVGMLGRELKDVGEDQKLLE